MFSIVFNKKDRLAAYCSFLSAVGASVFGIIFSISVIFGENFSLSISGPSFLNFGFLVDGLWELMSVISFFLVIYEHERSETRKAGFIYIVMTHIGTEIILGKSRSIKLIQTGSIHAYLSYIFGTMVILMLYIISGGK